MLAFSYQTKIERGLATLFFMLQSLLFIVTLVVEYLGNSGPEEQHLLLLQRPKPLL